MKLYLGWGGARCEVTKLYQEERYPTSGNPWCIQDGGCCSPIPPTPPLFQAGVPSGSSGKSSVVIEKTITLTHITRRRGSTRWKVEGSRGDIEQKRSSFDAGEIGRMRTVALLTNLQYCLCSGSQLPPSPLWRVDDRGYQQQNSVHTHAVLFAQATGFGVNVCSRPMLPCAGFRLKDASGFPLVYVLWEIILLEIGDKMDLARGE